MKIFDEYQQAAHATAGTTNLAVLALGIAGEAGEICDRVKKHLGHGHPDDRQKILEELGDLLWYVSELATYYQANLGEDVAGRNINKLKQRYPAGFSSERSLHRDIDHR